MEQTIILGHSKKSVGDSVKMFASQRLTRGRLEVVPKSDVIYSLTLTDPSRKYVIYLFSEVQK